MNSINFNEDDSDDAYHGPIISIKKVRSVKSINDLPDNFKHELSQMSLEDLSEHDVTLKSMIQKIQAMAFNRIVLTNVIGGVVNYVVVDSEVRLGSFILIRGNKLIATGEYEIVQQAFLTQIKKEYPGKFDTITFSDIDEVWIKNFSQIHFNNPKLFKLIKL